jgi:hypothetical protein
VNLFLLQKYPQANFLFIAQTKIPEHSFAWLNSLIRTKNHPGLRNALPKLGWQ